MASVKVQVDVVDALGGGKPTLEERLEFASRMASETIGQTVGDLREQMLDRLTNDEARQRMVDGVIELSRKAAAGIAREFLLRAEVTRLERQLKSVRALLRVRLGYDVSEG